MPKHGRGLSDRRENEEATLLNRSSPGRESLRKPKLCTAKRKLRVAMKELKTPIFIIPSQ